MLILIGEIIVFCLKLTQDDNHVIGAFGRRDNDIRKVSAHAI